MANLIKSEVKEDKTIPELKLWRAVLAQLLDDAFSSTYATKNKNDKDEARQYLQHMHRDYAKLCNNAGFDPKFVHTKVKTYFKLEKMRRI
jgi:hypothetical protein